MNWLIRFLEKFTPVTCFWRILCPFLFCSFDFSVVITFNVRTTTILAALWPMLQRWSKLPSNLLYLRQSTSSPRATDLFFSEQTHFEYSNPLFPVPIGYEMSRKPKIVEFKTSPTPFMSTVFPALHIGICLDAKPHFDILRLLFTCHRHLFEWAPYYQHIKNSSKYFSVFTMHVIVLQLRSHLWVSLAGSKSREWSVSGAHIFRWQQDVI